MQSPASQTELIDHQLLLGSLESEIAANVGQRPPRRFARSCTHELQICDVLPGLGKGEWNPGERKRRYRTGGEEA
jgi:hypothetical protein